MGHTYLGQIGCEARQRKAWQSWKVFKHLNKSKFALNDLGSFKVAVSKKVSIHKQRMKPRTLNSYKIIIKQLLNLKYFFLAYWPKDTDEIWKNHRVTRQITF